MEPGVRPSVFVGSSTKGLPFAYAARAVLKDVGEVTLWNEGFFRPGSTFIESLVNGLPRFDFAVLILTPDDLVVRREVEAFSPRDNVLFELGLFMGRLGRSRTFIVQQADGNLALPSDLAGVTTATYHWPRQDGEHASAVGEACDSIRQAMVDLGLIETKVSQHLNQIESRQSVTEGRLGEAMKRIDQVFLLTMSDAIFLNLRKLASGSFGPFESSGTFRRELRHLRDIGYIRVQGNIGALPARGGELSEYVSVTPVGRQFVALREAFEKGEGLAEETGSP